MELPASLIQLIQAPLDARSAELREGLRTVLLERTFPPHPRFKNGIAPALDPETDAVRGIFVYYTFMDFDPWVCGLSKARGWKCGSRRLLLPREDDPWYPEMADEFVESHPTEQEGEASDCFWETQVRLLETWVIDAWQAVRDAAPELRGFLAEHEASRYLDMDTGEEIEPKKSGLGWL